MSEPERRFAAQISRPSPVRTTTRDAAPEAAPEAHLQRQTAPGNQAAQAMHIGDRGHGSPPVTQALQSSGGEAMAPDARAPMERTLGADFGDVRVHTGGTADRAARDLGAHAFTSGRDIFFAAGAYQPGTTAGQRLLAHELTHTVQQAATGSQSPQASMTVSQPGDADELEAERVATTTVAPAGDRHAEAQAARSAAPVVRSPRGRLQRFGSTEHQRLGDSASGGATINLDIGDPAHPLTHGEMVALSGDYFGSVEEIQTLAQSDDGKAQLRWARFQALHTGSPGQVSQEAKDRVKDRYYRLAAVNVSHFSAGGTARTEYGRRHREAMQELFMGGATGNAGLTMTGRLTEAFSQHFLSDMFSAGHVRTPRADIRAWYDQYLGDSVARFVAYTASQITTTLDTYGDIPFFVANSTIRAGVAENVRSLGGSAVDSFSLGDIVSLAMHDRENREGLWVISDLDERGNAVPGGFHWPEMAQGDDHLVDGSLTSRMALAAMRDSLMEAQQAYDAGVATTAHQLLTPEALEVALNLYMRAYPAGGALGYVPRSDDARNQGYISGPSAPSSPGKFDYRWGNLDAIVHDEVDRTVKQVIAAKLADMAGSVGDADGMVYKADIAEYLPGLGPDMVGHNFPLVSLHVRRAFQEYVEHLRTNGIVAVENAMGRRSQGVSLATTGPDGGLP